MLRVTVPFPLLPAAPAQAATPTLRAGVARPTSRRVRATSGWTRADRTAQGQHTRLHPRAMVLARGDREVAPVSADLSMVPAGVVRHIGERLAGAACPSRAF